MTISTLHIGRAQKVSTGGFLCSNVSMSVPITNKGTYFHKFYQKCKTPTSIDFLSPCTENICFNIMEHVIVACKLNFKKNKKIFYEQVKMSQLFKIHLLIKLNKNV